MAQPQLPGTHDDLITINVTFAPATLAAASLTTILVLLNDATPLGGRVAEYTTEEAVAADVVAANLPAEANQIASIMFGQTTTRPERILFGQVDKTVGLETGADGLDACIAAGAQFYGVIYADRDPSRQVALAVDVEAKTSAGIYLLLGLQDDDPDWWTTGLPAAWTGIADFERTVLYYHDDNAADASSDYLDAAHFANRLSWDPDERGVKWNSSVQQVDPLTTAPTQAEKDFARANGANLCLPFSPTTNSFVALAETMALRPVEHVVSADWARVRIQEAVSTLIVERSELGLALDVSEAGQALIGAAIEGVLRQGVDVKHFLDYQLNPEPISAADISAERVRFSGYIQWSTGIRRVSINLFFDAQAIAA